MRTGGSPTPAPVTATVKGMAEDSGDAVPLVSVVLPTHRPTAYFSLALDSVRTQTWPSVELIVVDDGWSDHDLLVRTVGDAPSTRVVRHDPAGIAQSRNHGLAEATGSLIAFLDHDDLWRPDHLSTLVAAIGTDPSACASYGRFDVIGADGEILGEMAAASASADDVLGGGHRPSINSLLVRRDVLDRIGGFEPLLEPADDLDVIYKLVAEGPFVFSDRMTASWRKHRENTSRDLVICAEAADRMLQLHWAAAVARGDDHASRLLHANRTGAQDFWTNAVRKQSVQAWRSGDRRQAAHLLAWCARHSPRGLMKDMGHVAGRRLEHTVGWTRR